MGRVSIKTGQVPFVGHDAVKIKANTHDGNANGHNITGPEPTTRPFSHAHFSHWSERVCLETDLSVLATA
jgi:hypothetical protein